ncbi:MAG: hypothetical protein KGR98_09230 [Verrucomicrobia bacterium]|nr:hypothetical protein [Verrucomicrobiota bacterium]MDE3100341.1 hypothetical protein [Verrucomicrobiota bacterium]
MDSNAQLALMTKAKLVFESPPDTFLMFPALTPISYPPDQLNLPAIAGNSGQSQVLQEFSRLANTIPRGILFGTGDSDLLWDVYGNVLGVFDGGGDAVELAQASQTPGQNADLQQAEAYLYTQTTDGQRTASPAYVAYGQCQAAWTQATQSYTNAQIAASLSTDPAVKAQWQNTDGPKLRALVQAALDNWINNGNKEAVEQALQVVAASSTRLSPQIVWDGWKTSFQPGLDMLTDPNTNATYALTAFSPSNAASQTDWPTFTLSAQEIGQLVSQAPKELANIFGTAAGASGVSSLSFEFYQVVLNRSWFKPELFAARFWRFADPSVELSDGGNPAQGTLPAYISGLVFIRNIVVTPAAAAGTPAAGDATPTRLQSLPPISQFVDVHPFLFRPSPPVASPVLQPPADRIQSPIARIQPFVAAPPPAPPPSPKPSIAADAPVFRPPPLPRIQPALLSRIQAISFAATPAPQAPQTAAPATQQPDAGMISILAFICQRVPKSPNPDLTLAWEAGQPPT